VSEDGDEALMSEGLRPVGEADDHDSRAEANEREREAIRYMAARSRASDDNEPLTLVGAVIGDLYVSDRVRPGKRSLYVVRDAKTGKDCYLRGYELVRKARETVRNGGVVVMPRVPWQDEGAEASA
jgi:hypothetical protein